MTVFCVQNYYGTAAQFTLDAAPSHLIAVGDTGSIVGLDAWNAAALTFTVEQIIDTENFGVGSGNLMAANWPRTGTITWITGANAAATSNMTVRSGANAYMTAAEFMRYHDARGNLYAASPHDPIMYAIVKATDYLDQKYRYRGIKNLQRLGNPIIDPTMAFLDPFLSPFGIGSIPFMAPATSSQSTEWPRQGAVDLNGDMIMGIPPVLKAACAELAFRSLNGTELQPDYDPALVGAGGVVSSITEDVGPIKSSRTYDTKLGIGFFAPFPQVDRMLSKAGLTLAGTGRTLIR